MHTVEPTGQISEDHLKSSLLQIHDTGKIFSAKHVEHAQKQDSIDLSIYVHHTWACLS
jgi:hypothetical protein